MKYFLLCILFVSLSIQNIGQAQIIEGVMKEALDGQNKNEKIENATTPTAETELISQEILEKLKSPRNTMKTYLEAINLFKQDVNLSLGSLNDTILTFNLSEIAPGLRKVAGVQASEKLIGILDRIENIDLNSIPNYESGVPWTFIKEQLNYKGNVREFEITIAQDADKAWRFTPQTVSNINDYYQAVLARPLKEGVVENKNIYFKLKGFIASFGQDKILFFTASQWLGFGIVLLISLIIAGILKYLSIWYLSRLSAKREFEFSQIQIKRFALPFALLTFNIVWLIGINFIDFELEHYTKMARLFYILAAFSSVWFALKVVDLFTFHFQRLAAKTATKFDDTLVPMLSKTAKFLVVAFGTILVAHALTFDVRGLLAGLGIGGIAIALAAKDTIANLFGSVTVILDRPFQIGDYIYLNNIEGTVEDLGFRSTRIRTPEESLVSIPNSLMANMAIDNYGERKKRRFRANIEIDLSTDFDNIQKFCDDLKAYCKGNDFLNKGAIHAFINQITNKVIVVQVTTYINTTVAATEYQERHKLFLQILSLGKKHEISFSNNTTTVLLDRVSHESQESALPKE